MKQLTFKKVNGWGGKRSGAGRKKVGREVNHVAREKVDFRQPLHITKRLRPGLRGLRSVKMLEEFERCLVLAKAKGLHVLHFAIESNHLHILAEAKDNKALASGMNSLGASFGRVIRERSGGRGKVFEGRYHLEVLKNPSQTRNALAYVLLNQSKHKNSIPEIDRFSSARNFSDWKKLLGTGLLDESGVSRSRMRPGYLSEPRSWLARQGWQKAKSPYRWVSERA